MAKRTPTGLYNLRVVILARVLAVQGANAEQVESWPEPMAGTNEYFACRDNLNAGETITQGIRQSTGTMKLRIKGRSISVNAYDRIKKKATGEVFAITGVSREDADTVIMCERVHQQTTGQ